jgi:hypothetical protein
MRPTPHEELDGVRKVLADVVAPSVTDEYATAQLQQVLAVLGRLGSSWERAVPMLDAENELLSSILALVRQDLRALAGAAPIVDALVDPVASVRGNGSATAFERAQERNRVLRERLAATILALDGLDESPAVLLARDRIRRAMRANLDRALNPDGV